MDSRVACTSSLISDPPLGMSPFSVAFPIDNNGSNYTLKFGANASTWQFNTVSTVTDSQGNTRSRFRLVVNPGLPTNTSGLALQPGNMTVLTSMNGSSTTAAVYPVTFDLVDNAIQWDVDVLPANMVQVSVPNGASVVVIRPAGVQGWYLTECVQCNWTTAIPGPILSNVLPMVVMQTYSNNPRAQLVVIQNGT